MFDDEVAEMAKALEGETSEDPKDEKDPEPEPEPEPEPKSDDKSDDDEGEEEGDGDSDDSGSDDEGGQELPKSEEKEEKPSEIDQLKQTLVELRAELAELKAGKKQEPEKPADPGPEKDKEEEPKEHDFVGDLDLDEATRDPKVLNTVLNNIYKKAMIDSRTAIIKQLPTIVEERITVQNALKKLSEDFYSENSDLKGFPKVVALVYNELASANPNSTIQDIMKDVAPEVRKRLGLPAERKVAEKKADDQKPDDKGTQRGRQGSRLPSKGRSTGRLQTEVDKNSFDSQIDEMNKVIER